MYRPFLNALVLGTFLVCTLIAAPFWATKPYTEWTKKEVEKLLGDSPWMQSAKVELDLSSMPRGARGEGSGGGVGGPGGGMGGPGGGVGGPGGGMGGPGGGVGGPGGGMGGPGGGMGGPGGRPQMPTAYVMWQSALPIRQAMAQAAILSESPSAESLEAQLATEPTQHILAVMGLQGGPAGQVVMRRPSADGAGAPAPPSPEQQAEMRERMHSQMMENTTLTIDSEKLAPEKIETVLNGSERVLVFYFPKSTEVSSRTKKLEFETQTGPLKLKVRFKPKDMMFN